MLLLNILNLFIHRGLRTARGMSFSLLLRGLVQSLPGLTKKSSLNYVKFAGRATLALLSHLGELLVVHIPDGGDLPGVGLLNGGHLLLQPAILQLQASHVLNVSSEPEL